MPCVLFCLQVAAQKNNAAIHKGNELYKQKDFEASQQEYNKVLTTEPANATANYNNGNAQFRGNKPDEAIKSYDNTIAGSKDKILREKAFYNKGVALSKQQKLQESIDAWKESLKLDANDQEARENLQKALAELKKQQEQQKNDENKDKKDKKQDQKQKQQDKKPQEQQSKLNKQQVEQLLKALQQKEKEIQQKMQKGNPSPNKPDKDW